jgi:hypothetical protein
MSKTKNLNKFMPKTLFILIIIFCLTGCSTFDRIGSYECDNPGYVYDKEVGACINAEDIVFQDTGAKIAVDFVGRSKGLTVVSMHTALCIGCFSVNLEKGEKQQPKEKITVHLSNYKPSLVSPSNVCSISKGTWLEEFNECEYLSKEKCDFYNGDFFECESACRHTVSDEPIPCTLQCVPVCEF